MGEPVDRCVQRLAEQKALQVCGRLRGPGLPVLGADTAVVIDDAMLGKPRDRRDGLEMLARLSGREHEVICAVALAQRGTLASRLSRSIVRFRPLSAAEIEDYVSRVYVLDKAGAYAAQEDPIGLIEGIEGSRTNVIGLPMERLEPMLAQRGYRSA